jgi:myo-inositol-1-phosphate synthase
MPCAGQGTYGAGFYRQTGSLVGIHRPAIGGLGVGDIAFVAAFAIAEEKIGKDLTEAIFMPPNTFLDLNCDLPKVDVPVTKSPVDATEVDRVATALEGKGQRRCYIRHRAADRRRPGSRRGRMRSRCRPSTPRPTQ